jgi:hypothetical protein
LIERDIRPLAKPYAWLRHVLTGLPLRQPGDDGADLLQFNYAMR